MGGVAEFTRFAVAMTKTSVPLYWSNAAEVLVGWISTKTLALAGAMVLAGLVGVALLAPRFPAMSLSLVLTLGVLAIWPYVQDRFLTHVLPVLGVAAAFAVQRTLALVPTAARRAALAGVALMTVACPDRERTSSRGERSRSVALTSYALAIAQMVDWIDANTAPRRAHHGRVGRRHLSPHRASHVDPESRGTDARHERLRPAVSIPRDTAARGLGGRRHHLGSRAGTGGRGVARARGAVSRRTHRSRARLDDARREERRAISTECDRDPPCLRQLARAEPAPVSTQNKNAP